MIGSENIRNKKLSSQHFYRPPAIAEMNHQRKQLQLADNILRFEKSPLLMSHSHEIAAHLKPPKREETLSFRRQYATALSKKTI